MARGNFEPNRDEPTPASLNGRRVMTKEEEAHELTPLQTTVVHEVKVVPKAPDGGYGWIIVIASFFCNFIVDGVAYSGSQYIVAWSDAFPLESKSTVSLTISLLNGVYLLMGPVSSALTNAFGFRIVIFSGALITCAAFIISVFARSITYLILSFGVLGGIGFGLIYSPSILCVCYYFDKKRAMAVGISVCGSGVGAFVFPPLIQMVLDEYGWQGSMLILAGLVLQVCIAGSLMRTLTVDVVEEVKVVGDLDRTGLTGELKGDSRIRSPSGVSTQGMDLVSSKKYSSTHGIDIQTLEGGRVTHDIRSGPYKLHSSQPDINDPMMVPGIHRSQETAAPLERKDVHVQGSLKHLNRQESEQVEVEQFRKDSLSRRQQQAAAAGVPAKKGWLPPQLRQALIEMADVRIYSNLVFLIFSLASFLGMIAFYIPFAFVPDHAIRAFGIDKTTSAYLISAIGLTNILGRIFWGWLADRPRMDPLIIHNCCIFVVGIVVGFLPLCGTYEALMGICLLFGFFVSPFISLLSIILTSRIGLEQLPSAFGQSQLVRGIASMVGAPIGGALFESTQNYSVTFWASAAALLAASVIASLILVLSFFTRRRQSSPKIRANIVA